MISKISKLLFVGIVFGSVSFIKTEFEQEQLSLVEQAKEDPFILYNGLSLPDQIKVCKVLKKARKSQWVTFEKPPKKTVELYQKALRACGVSNPKIIPISYMTKQEQKEEPDTIAFAQKKTNDFFCYNSDNPYRFCSEENE